MRNATRAASRKSSSSIASTSAEDKISDATTKTGEVEEMKGYTCLICSNTYKTKLLFRHHMKDHKPKGPFTCEICNKIFQFLSKLKIHLKSHQKQQSSDNETIVKKDYSCSICQIQFKSKHEFLVHNKSTHTHVQSPSSMQQNKQRIGKKLQKKTGVGGQTKQKKHPCADCGREVVIESQLRNKNKVTTTPKKKDTVVIYRCNLCRIRTVSKNVREFSCHICDKSYRLKKSFLKHMSKAHTMEESPLEPMMLGSQVVSVQEEEEQPSQPIIEVSPPPLPEDSVQYEDGKCVDCGKEADASSDVNFPRCSECLPPFLWIQRNLRMCHNCEKSFLNERELNSHISRSHGNDKPFECGNCTKCFRYIEAVEIHQISCTPIQPTLRRSFR